MRAQNYKPTQYAQFTNAEAQAVYADLEKDGESREFIELFISVILEQNQGIRDFGRESAKELIIMAIAKRLFAPELLKKSLARLGETK